jgi:hypothetical protein
LLIEPAVLVVPTRPENEVLIEPESERTRCLSRLVSDENAVLTAPTMLPDPEVFALFVALMFCCAAAEIAFDIADCSASEPSHYCPKYMIGA